ncbi:MAG: redoxin domain-containing protein [Candidatus Niyogibacteria bacterium]|nr:redoxin domain-containing protein [Candidatus Niyogibacteria bacterium]
MTRMPAITGDTWFHSKPLTAEDLRGRIVLVDFWTYSCVNCQRTLPYLRDWWSKYKDKDFILLGVHSPEFEFEKDPRNVEAALKKFGVEWPVVLDNDHVIWDAFANRYWPAKYLADRKGEIVYTHFGEGGYTETEREIQRLLGEDRTGESMPAIAAEEHGHGNVCFIPTPETYCGYERGALANEEGHQENTEFDYRWQGELPEDSIALDGRFFAAAEYVESRAEGASLLLRFRATEVNLVMRPVSGKEAEVSITFDGEAPDPARRGRDADENGGVRIREPDLYNLLKSDEVMEGILRLRADVGNFQAYAFTFSGCAE